MKMRKRQAFFKKKTKTVKFSLLKLAGGKTDGHQGSKTDGYQGTKGASIFRKGARIAPAIWHSLGIMASIQSDHWAKYVWGLGKTGREGA